MISDDEYLNRIFSKTTVNANGCWIYKGALRSGYGWMNYKGKSRGAHRVVLIIITGKNLQKPNVFACHKNICSSRACVNPSHLYWGSRLDNVRDMCEAGKHNWHTHVRRGDKHPSAVITNADVRKARRMYKAGKDINEISVATGYKKTTLNNIIYSKTRFKGIE